MNEHDILKFSKALIFNTILRKDIDDILNGYNP